MESVLAAAARVAGAKSVEGADGPIDLESPAIGAAARTLAKFLSRRSRKVLEEHGRRFEKEPLDVAGWRRDVLRGANRFGLLVAGDLASAVSALSPDGSLPSDRLRTPEAVELILFALGDRYGALRREVGLGPQR
jgi:hypothetical protein